MIRPAKERFWEKVDKNGPLPEKPELGNCWDWLGSKRKRSGHGYFRYNNTPGLPHRFSYEIHNGHIPEGLDVLHKCDRGCCVRPDHLFVGTQADNSRDMKEKGRSCHGTRRSNAVLDDTKAVEIYTLYHLNGMTLGQLAEKFGVPPGRISKVKNGLAWGHATKHLTFPKRKGLCGPSVKE